jgi:hypothetical protein
MAKPKIFPDPPTALGQSERVGPPSGVSQAPKAPMITRKSNVGKDNFAKVRFQQPPGPKLGNHK